MNILFLSIYQFNEYGGGLDNVCTQLIQHFLASGHFIIMCYGNTIARSYSLQESEQIKLNILPDKEVNSSTNCIFLANLIEKHQIHFVLDESFNVEYHNLCVAVKALTPFKLISHYHGDPRSPLKSLRDNYELVFLKDSVNLKSIIKKIAILIKYPFSYILRLNDLRKKYKKYYKESDAYVFLSDSYVEIVASLIGEKNQKNKFYYISNPIKISRGEIESNKSNSIVFVGRLVYQKRVDRLLDAWKYVQIKCPGIQLVIVGDGEAKDDLLKYSERLRLQNVKFVGYRSSAEYVADSIALCMVSSHEGLPMTLLEAKSMMTIPIAYGSFESVHDIIKDQYDGIIVPPFSRKKLADAIISVCEDPELRNRLSFNASQTVVNNSIEKVSNEWYKLFSMLQES